MSLLALILAVEDRKLTIATSTETRFLQVSIRQAENRNFHPNMWISFKEDGSSEVCSEIELVRGMPQSRMNRQGKFTVQVEVTGVYDYSDPNNAGLLRTSFFEKVRRGTAAVARHFKDNALIYKRAIVEYSWTSKCWLVSKIQDDRSPPRAIEGVVFYIENGFAVFHAPAYPMSFRMELHRDFDGNTILGKWFRFHPYDNMETVNYYEKPTEIPTPTVATLKGNNDKIQIRIPCSHSKGGGVKTAELKVVKDHNNTLNHYCMNRDWSSVPTLVELRPGSNGRAELVLASIQEYWRRDHLFPSAAKKELPEKMKPVIDHEEGISDGAVRVNPSQSSSSVFQLLPNACYTDPLFFDGTDDYSTPTVQQGIDDVTTLLGEFSILQEANITQQAQLDSQAEHYEKLQTILVRIGTHVEVMEMLSDEAPDIWKDIKQMLPNLQ